MAVATSNVAKMMMMMVAMAMIMMPNMVRDAGLVKFKSQSLKK